MDARHEEIKALIAPYVLGAVPSDEEALVRSHLLTCDECREEADTLGSSASALSLAVDPVELPDGFVERTMARVADERPQTETARPRRRSKLAWALSAAALVVIAAVVALVALGRGGPPDPAEVAALLERPGLELSGDGVDAKVVETEDGTVFVARGLDQAPEGKVYALWQMKGSCAPGDKGPCQIEPSVTFEPREGAVVVDVPAPLEDFSDAAVTVEEGPVDEPTTQPVLASF